MKPLGRTDPTKVGAYRLSGVLGDGGMGRVYLGRSPTGRRGAIKGIRTDLAEDVLFRRRFAREGAAGRAGSPPFPAPVVGAGTHPAPPPLPAVLHPAPRPPAGG